MGIQVTFQMDDEEETFIMQKTLDILPMVGECIWFCPIGGKKACKVIEVAHWVSIEKDNNYHAACVYLQEI